MKNSIIIASQANIGLLLDRFNKFINRNSDKSFSVKNTWGKPKKRETWKGHPVNHKLTVPPRVCKHHGFGKNEYLIAIQPQSTEDLINIHFNGYGYSGLKAHFPNYKNPQKTPISSFTVEEGDKVCFKNEQIIVIPKRADSCVKKICSFSLMPN